MWTPVEKWECGECNDLHDDEDDARECCRPSVYEVYVCPICDEAHESESEAVECIAKCELESNTKTYMASKIELEKQGQERLF